MKMSDIQSYQSSVGLEEVFEEAKNVNLYQAATADKNSMC